MESSTSLTVWERLLGIKDWIVDLFSTAYSECTGLLNAIGGHWPVIGVLILIVVLPIFVARTILGPVNRRAGRLRATVRFQLSDFLCLHIQFQFALAYCVRFVGIEHRTFFVLLLSFLSLATLALWAGAVSFMSRAAVVDPWRRAVFVLFLLPSTLAVLMTSTSLLLIVADMVLHMFSELYRVQLENMLFILALQPIHLAIGLACIPVLSWILRRIALWVVGREGPPARTVVMQSPAAG